MSRKLIYLLLVLSLTTYLVSGYYLKRENFWLLITLYSGLFATYFLLLRFKQDIGLSTGIAAGLICRFVLLFSVPALSDDFYRFLWDGRLQHLGINPFDLSSMRTSAREEGNSPRACGACPSAGSR